MKFIAKQLIKFYKLFFSPIVGKSCRYTPTCSSYAYQAIDKYGAFIGSFMAIFRIMKCNPFSKGGLDPVRENLRGGMKWLL